MVHANTALPQNSYVPILKGKRAELDAIGGAISDRLVPLFEILDPLATSSAIAKAWPHPEQIVWIQVLNPDGIEDATFSAQVQILFDELRSAGVAAVPVITATEEPATLAAVKAIDSADGRGVVIRFDIEDLIDESINNEADIESTLVSLSISQSNIDVVIDAGLLTGSATVQSAVASQGLHALPALNDWRSRVVAFSAFPAAVGDVVARDSIAVIPRTDAAAFVATRRSAEAEIVFGDYAIGIPTYGGAPFTPIPNIRYAAGADWYVHRAKERKAPGPQYRKLAADIIGAPYYDGPAFSPGDSQINGVAAGTSGPGNATTHLRAGMSRHVHLVLSRLAILGEP